MAKRKERGPEAGDPRRGPLVVVVVVGLADKYKRERATNDEGEGCRGAGTIRRCLGPAPARTRTGCGSGSLDRRRIAAAAAAEAAGLGAATGPSSCPWGRR